MKKAFTMIELVFVIVVMGILAAAIIPSTRTNPVQEAAVQVLSHIRYTQHLAMLDDKYDSTNPNWYMGRWQLLFGTSTFTNGLEAYSIFSDAGAFSGNPGITELARNPGSNDKLLTGGFAGVIDFDTDSRVTRKMNIGASYGITTVTFSPTCSIAGSKRIAFDYLGRPLRGNLLGYVAPYPAANRLITQNCDITLSNITENVIIRIRPETGFSCILNAAGTNCI